MPDNNGVLSEEEKKTIIDWVNKKAQLVRCPSCRGKSFNISEHLVSPPVFHGGGNIVISGGISYPQVMMNCKNCGNTMFYNAVMIGVVKNDEENMPQDQEGK